MKKHSPEELAKEQTAPPKQEDYCSNYNSNKLFSSCSAGKKPAPIPAPKCEKSDSWLSKP